MTRSLMLAMAIESSGDAAAKAATPVHSRNPLMSELPAVAMQSVIFHVEYSGCLRDSETAIARDLHLCCTHLDTSLDGKIIGD